MTHHIQSTRSSQQLLGLAQQAVNTREIRSSALFRDVHAFISLARSSADANHAHDLLQGAARQLHLLSERSEASSYNIAGLQNMFHEAQTEIQRRFSSWRAPTSQDGSTQTRRPTVQERNFEQSFQRATRHYQSSVQHGRLATQTRDGALMFSETQSSVREANQARRGALQAMRQAHQIRNPQIRSAAIARVTLLLSDLRTAEARNVEGMVQQLRSA